MKAKIKAVIFDMDGVLIDAREWHYESLNTALAHFGFEISRADHLSTFDGLPTKRKLQLLSEQGALPGRLHSLINALKQKYTMEIIYRKCVPTFNHRFALSTLKSQGYVLAVASNSIRSTVAAMMSLAGLEEFLDLQLSNEDVVNAKPSPEIYLKAIESMGVRAEECVIVEDNPRGIEAARASGAHVLEVADPSDVTFELIKSFILQVEV